jgi:NADH-quinone oxidoreductase subunit L
LGSLGIVNLLEQARPAGTAGGMTGGGLLAAAVTVPSEAESHVGSIHVTATLTAFATATAGVLLAAAFYLWGLVRPAAIAAALRPLHTFLENRWYFDEIYQWIFVKPVLGIASLASANDRGIIDSIISGSAMAARGVAGVGSWLDRSLVDGLVNAVAEATWSIGQRLRKLQTGRLRQYVMFIVVGTVALFMLASVVFRTSIASP